MKAHKGTSLVDWNMSSDRNWHEANHKDDVSLVDWNMSSDRNSAVAGEK